MPADPRGRFDRTERTDACVVGSGFGGSIAAFRLAAAGWRVIVLERGRRWAPEEFPRDPFDGRRLLWREPGRRGWNGLYDLRFLSGIATLTAAGVGGGSLVYANVLIRPDARIFDERWPPGSDLAALAPYYERVETILAPRPLPPELAVRKDAAMAAAVGRLGRAADLVHPALAVEWDAASEHGCRLVAECEFGCRFGAKRTLDRTYLAAAVEHGAEVRSGILVRAIEPLPSHGFRIHALDLATRSRRVIEARIVVLAAGTLGTAELLLRSRDEWRLLPRLSPRLGERFSGNGDFIGLIRGTADDLEPWRGPDVTSVLRSFETGPGFTIATPTFSQPVMAALVRAPAGASRAARIGGRLIWPWLDAIVPRLLGGGPATALVRTLARTAQGGPPDERPIDPRLEASRATAVFAIGRDSADGRIVLRARGPFHVDVEWPYASKNAALVARMQRTLRELAGAYGGELALSPTWELGGRILTVHPLGGCVIAASPDDGVVGTDGQVHGYPGLFVADASVIPSSIGFHPALTIAAVAERTAEAAAAA